MGLRLRREHLSQHVFGNPGGRTGAGNHLCAGPVLVSDARCHLCGRTAGSARTCGRMNPVSDGHHGQVLGCSIDVRNSSGVAARNGSGAAAPPSISAGKSSHVEAANLAYEKQGLKIGLLRIFIPALLLAWRLTARTEMRRQRRLRPPTSCPSRIPTCSRWTTRSSFRSRQPPSVRRPPSWSSRARSRLTLRATCRSSRWPPGASWPIHARLGDTVQERPAAADHSQRRRLGRLFRLPEGRRGRDSGARSTERSKDLYRARRHSP